MGSVMDQERPWEREDSPPAKTIRQRIVDAYQCSGGNLNDTMEQTIAELETLERRIIALEKANIHAW